MTRTGEKLIVESRWTLVRNENRLSYHVGAGIVADSDPEKEYEETLHKAAGIRMAVERYKQ